MKEEKATYLAIGFVVGAFAMGVFISNVGPDSSIKIETRKAACEINLPRSQVCVMQFVPKSVDR